MTPMVRAILPEPMDPPTLAARIVAALLVLTWTGLAAVLAVGRGIGVPTDLSVGLGAVIGAIVAALGLAGLRATGRTEARRQLGAGMVALLLAAALAATVAEPFLAGREQLQAPVGRSWATITALAATALHTALARQADGRALALAVVLCVAGAGLVGAGQLLDRPPVPVAGCAPPSVAAAARVEVTAEAQVDGRTIGHARQAGERSGEDEHWTGERQSEVVGSLEVEYVGRSDGTWLRVVGGTWQPAVVPAGAAGTGATLDRRAAALIGEATGPAVEDLGVEMVDGVAARHCRVVVAGPAALEAYLPLGWLVGREALGTGATLPGAGATLPVWRGELDWWSDGTGDLMAASVYIGGHPADAWRLRGVRGRLAAQLVVSERGVPRVIVDPLP